MPEPRYPNMIPARERSGYYHKDRYSSGPVRDGHKLVYIDGEGISVIHPPECEALRSDDAPTALVCPWDYAWEGIGDSWVEAYCSGDPFPVERLPEGVEVEVTWEIESGASWTDYGWEYDTAFSWWFGDEEHLQDQQPLRGQNDA